MKIVRVDRGLEELTFRQALEALPVVPGGPADQAVKSLLRRLEAALDIGSLDEALEAGRDALGRCEARVRDLTGTTRGGLRACGTTLRADGVCPAALTHLVPAKD